LDLSDIYNEIITEHNLNSPNKRSLDNPSKTEKGHNPSCGDDIKLELKLDGDIIKDAAFIGTGCAISQASTSIMIDVIKGKTVKEALRLTEKFLDMIKGNITEDEKLEDLEEAVAFKNISKMPARVKCAVLAWHTLQEAVKNN
jgi:nitrogen fixation NifU-like protein